MSKIQALEKLKEDPLYKKAKKETKVLDKLLELKEDCHVLCGVKINIKKFKKIKARDLKFDYIVVNNKGIFLIKINKDQEDPKEKYSKEELDQFDYYILLNIEKLEDTFSDFYNEYKSSDLVKPDTEQYKVLKIMEETEENLKKTGQYTKDKYDLEVYNKLKQEGYL